MIDHIKISSIRHEFEMLSKSIEGNLDIIIISETKLDSTFPSNQFTIEGYAALIRLETVEEKELFYIYGRISKLDC